MSRAIGALVRLRRLALDAAKRDLAAALAAEAEALSVVEATSGDTRREAAFAGASAGTDGPSAFAAWLTEARTRHDAERRAHAHAEAQTGGARTGLADARTALRIVEETASAIEPRPPTPRREPSSATWTKSGSAARQRHSNVMRQRLAPRPPRRAAMGHPDATAPARANSSRAAWSSGMVAAASCPKWASGAARTRSADAALPLSR